MKQSDRPTHIRTILEAVRSASDAELSAELETYIADLEAKQPDRPTRIVSILRTIALHHPTDTSAALEAYISELESNQQPVSPAIAPSLIDSHDNPPVWSHQRSMEHEQHRRERAIRKRNNYQ